MSRESTKGDYIWTAHALRQMKRRRITSEQVLTALNAPELPEVSRTTGSLCHRHTYPDGRILKVWVSPGTRGPRSIKSTAWEGEDD